MSDPLRRIIQTIPDYVIAARVALDAEMSDEMTRALLRNQWHGFCDDASAADTGNRLHAGL